MDEVGRFIHDRFFAAGDLTGLSIGLAAAIGVLLVGWPGTWHYLRYAITTIHELGHVVIGWLVGRSVRSVNLNHDTSGLTMTRGRPTGPGIFLLYAAGYPAPCLVGLGLMSSAIYGRAGWGMTALVAVLLLALVLVRNLFGVVVVLIQLVLYGAVWVVNEPRLLGGLVMVLGTVLSIGGLRATLGLWTVHRRRSATGSDAAVLGRQTRLGASVWSAIFVLIAVASLVVAALLVWSRAAELSAV